MSKHSEIHYKLQASSRCFSKVCKYILLCVAKRNYEYIGERFITKLGDQPIVNESPAHHHMTTHSMLCIRLTPPGDEAHYVMYKVNTTR